MILRALLSLVSMTGIPRLFFRLMLDGRVSLILKLIPVLVFAYLILPIDLVADLLPIFGRLDDVVVIIAGIALFLVLAPKEVVSEHIRRRGTVRSEADDEVNGEGKVIDGDYSVKDD